MSDLLSALFDFSDLFAKRPKTVPALMGDGAGTLDVPGKPRWVWVRPSGGDAAVAAYNDRVPNVNDQPVLVGYDPIQPTLFQVLSIRHTYDGVVSVASVPGHHANHQWLDSAGGQDVVYSQARQLMPLRLSASGLTVSVYASPYKTSTGWAWVNASLSLSSHVPASGARYVLVSLSSAGTLTATAGSVVAMRFLLTPVSIPALPDGHYPLAAVVMYAGQTAITETTSVQDVLDLRFTGVGGSGGGGATNLESVLFYG